MIRDTGPLKVGNVMIRDTGPLKVGKCIHCGKVLTDDARCIECEVGARPMESGFPSTACKSCGRMQRLHESFIASPEGARCFECSYQVETKHKGCAKPPGNQVRERRCIYCKALFPLLYTIRDAEGEIWCLDCDRHVHPTINPPAKPDMVNQPPHYKKHPSGVECITVTEHFNFCRGNAIKYIWRAGDKGSEIEDLKKARWYLDREIERLEGEKK